MSDFDHDRQTAAREIRQPFPAGSTGAALAASAMSAWLRADAGPVEFGEHLRLASTFANRVHELPLASIWISVDTTLAEFVDRHVAESAHSDDDAETPVSAGPRI